MEYKLEGNVLTLEKNLSNLDKFVFKFIKKLDVQKLNYVIISGYIPILFGRSRETEDVDLFLEKPSFEEFKKLWESLQEEFDCINAFSAKEAYADYLTQGIAIRFSLKNNFIPNIEVKFAKTGLNQHSLDNKIKAIVNGTQLFISNLEMQIAFKLYLGSDKDIEDAIHLWTIFKKDLDKTKLNEYAKILKVTQKLGELE